MESSYYGQIDSGQIKAVLKVDVGGYGQAGDKAEVVFRALDKDGKPLKTVYHERPAGYDHEKKEVIFPFGGDHDWETANLPLELPAGTRSLGIELWGFEGEYPEHFGIGDNYGTLDAYFKDVSVTLYDMYDPIVKSITTDSPNNSYYKAGQNINISVKFSEPVNHSVGGVLVKVGGKTDAYDMKYEAYLNGGQGTDTLTFTFTVPSYDEQKYNWTNQPVEIAGWSFVTYIVDNSGRHCDSIIEGKIEGKNIYVDNTTPVVSQVTCTRPDGVYGVGDNIGIKVKFSEKVKVNGNPVLKLDTGSGSDEVASYTGMSESDTVLNFSYTVKKGDNTPEGLYVKYIEGGKITDLAGNEARTDSSVDRISLNRRFSGIKLDTQGPDISFDEPADKTTYKRTHQVKISATDEMTEVRHVKYIWSTGESAEPLNWDEALEAREGTNVECPLDTGEFYLHAKATDNVDNESYATSGPYYFDNTPPSISATPEPGKAALSHSVKISVSDDHSGPGDIEYYWVNTEKGMQYETYPISNGSFLTTPRRRGNTLSI